MKHHILVKWADPAMREESVCREVEALFQETLAIPGVHKVEVLPNVVDRPNRYDLLILITMDREALADYDACAAHHRWKDGYGAKIEKKAIFDCE